MIKFETQVDYETRNKLFGMVSSQNTFELSSIDSDGIAEFKQLIEFNNTKKPRTKVEYVNVGFHKAHEAMYEHEMVSPLFILGDFGFEKAEPSQVVNGYIKLLYRKLERELTWGDVLRDTMKKKGTSIGTGSIRVGGVDLSDSDFLIMVHEIASMTDKPEGME